jgi:predicted transcriptional regulator
VRKLIDIPEDIIKDLKHMAVNADKSLKIFIQDALAELVKKNREKGKK